MTRASAGSAIAPAFPLSRLTRTGRVVFDGPLLCTAEVIALRCHGLGIDHAFAYPGTSELALCRAFSALGSGMLVNARGDGEAVFMAGGAGMAGHLCALAIVHGARGLTNAAGAVADLSRNEFPALVIVGLPSTRSARFLPPHGENGLLDTVGRFAKVARELSWPTDSRTRTLDPVRAVDDAAQTAAALPRGPVLLGIPQDVLEARVVPAEAAARPLPAHVANPIDVHALGRAQALLRRARSPVILIDDYVFRHHGADTTLLAFAEALDAPIFQVRYRRGPMLFQQLTVKNARCVAGLYDPERKDHRDRMNEADLLVTIEDRNLYYRVVGHLPGCAKIAITSDAHKTAKNGYLSSSDVLVRGEPVAALGWLIGRLTGTRRSLAVACSSAGRSKDQTQEDKSPAQIWLRDALAGVICACRAVTGARHVVDDSQMVGGVLVDVYETVFGEAAVFGDHGGFVGAGIPLATGLAIARRLPVLCLVGDQGFTNGCQGLVCAAQEKAPVMFMVCNNGESVSLRKQSGHTARENPPDDFERLLRNAPDFSYVAAAQAAGIAAASVDLRYEDLPEPAAATQQVLESSRVLWRQGGPALIELRLPGLGPAWDGVWATRGFDEIEALSDRPAGGQR